MAVRDNCGGSPSKALAISRDDWHIVGASAIQCKIGSEEIGEHFGFHFECENFFVAAINKRDEKKL